jgi:hypothetical protein
VKGSNVHQMGLYYLGSNITRLIITRDISFFGSIACHVMIAAKTKIK